MCGPNHMFTANSAFELQLEGVRLLVSRGVVVWRMVGHVVWLRLGHCAIFAFMLHTCLLCVGPGLAIPLAYGATRTITSSSWDCHGPHCRLWTVFSVGVVVCLRCGVGWGAAAAAYLATCPRRMLLWPARMTPEEDVGACGGS